MQFVQSVPVAEVLATEGNIQVSGVVGTLLTNNVTCPFNYVISFDRGIQETVVEQGCTKTITCFLANNAAIKVKYVA